jgi:hypothetical protein
MEMPKPADQWEEESSTGMRERIVTKGRPPMYVEADVTTTQLPVKAASGARPYMPMGGRHQHADVEHPQSRRLSTLAICVLTGINSSALHRMAQPATLQL